MGGDVDFVTNSEMFPKKLGNCSPPLKKKAKRAKKSLTAF
jgi:hypothetical protein